MTTLPFVISTGAQRSGEISVWMLFLGNVFPAMHENISRRGPLNRRSLHSAPPDFPWRPVAPMNCMRFSLRKTAHVVLASGAKWEIRVRSGRDDKGEGCDGRISRQRSSAAAPLRCAPASGTKSLRENSFLERARLQPCPLVPAPDFSPGERAFKPARTFRI
jgi:hypothetical protein